MEFTPEFTRQLARRDEQAFGKLYQHMVDRLYRYVAGRYRMDRATISDLLSDFFVKLRNQIDRVKADYSLEAWIWTVFRNFLIDYFKANKTSVRLDDVPEKADTDMMSPDGYVQQTHQLAQIYAVLDKLDEVSREIVLLRYVEQLPFDQIAQITGLQEDAVRQRASRAVKTIQSLVQ